MEEAGEDKKAAGACLESVKLEEEKYRLGNTKACQAEPLELSLPILFLPSTFFI